MDGPDPRLVQDVIKGNERACLELSRSVEGLVCAAIRQGSYFLPSEHDEEALRAELRARIFLSLAAWDPDKGSFSSWIYGIARNLLNGYLRERSRRPQWVPLDALRHVPVPALDAGAPARLTGESPLIGPFWKAVARMSREDRIVVKHMLDGAPHKELARRLHVSEAAAKMRVHRLRGRLRILLDGEVSGAA